MNKSRLINEDKVYVRFDHDGNTQMLTQNSITPGYSYRRVHDKIQNFRSNLRLGTQERFLDKKFPIDANELSTIDPKNGQVVLRRLYQLFRYSQKSTLRPMLFPPVDYIPPRKLSKDPFLPPVISQIDVFHMNHYKSFFVTQQINQNGLYYLIINNAGRFQIDYVDDWIPVYANTLEPIWGMDIDQAWQIIILKFWAKRRGGYLQVKNTPPFQFIQAFSNSNWKFFNLQRQGVLFLKYYEGRNNQGKFVLKTKNNNLVLNSGLIPNSAGYQMVNLTPLNNSQNPENKNYIVTVRSTFKNQWAGKMSVLDSRINQYYQNPQYIMSLQRDFAMNQRDFINVFSSAHIASRRDQRQKNYISDYYILSVQPNIKRSIYLKFTIPYDGWFDFCILQSDDNKIITRNSYSRDSRQVTQSKFSTMDGYRYLQCRYILAKENNVNSPSLTEDLDYDPPIYDIYEIQYSHGFNRGQARFLNIVRGNYILKIKPQSTTKPSIFVINYASNSLIEMEQYFPTKKQTSLIMRQAMASLIGVVQNYSLDKNTRFEQISFSNTFEEIGYGFVGARLKKTAPYRLLIDVDPAQVRASGYKVKNHFKRLNQPFSVLISPGQCTSVVLKKIPDVSYVWPPKGIQIFRQR